MTLKPQNQALSAGVVAVSTFFGVALCVVSNDASAAGFEKANLWSGKHAGVGSAVTASINDAEALYFNPAGLAAAAGLQGSLNISPTWSSFQGPITTSTVLSSETALTPPFGVFASLRPTEKLGVGFGAYSSGGSRATYNDVDFSGFGASFVNIKPDFKTELTIIEYSLGAGYEIIDGLRIGLAYRISQASAALSSGAPVSANGGTFVTALDLTDLKSTRYNGWRAGIQYSPKDSVWGLGTYWRSKIEYTAKGKANGQIAGTLIPGATVLPLTEGDVTASLPLPQQVGIGGFYLLGEEKRTRINLDYTFTQYGDIKQINYSGGPSNPAALGGTPIDLGANPTAINWMNESKYRIGVDHQLSDMLALRAGYVLVGQVTPTTLASATFTPPGIGHAASIGSGQKIMDGFLEFNEALEYTWGKSTGTNVFQQTGEFKADAWTIHLGATVRM